jgi:alanine racemase
MSQPAPRLVPDLPRPMLKPGATGLVTVDLAEIADNWKSLARLVAPAACGAVVKADAYGLGAARVIPALARAGCTTFFIATPGESEAARARAPNAVIYALDGLLPGAARDFARLGVRPVLSSLGDVETWAAQCRESGEKLACGLHIDSGLHRLGLAARDARRLAADTKLRGALDLTLVMSHLASADNPADPKNRDQLLTFETLSALFPGVPRSLAASDGLMLGKPFHFDVVRPGYALYGGQASAANPAPVHAAVTVSAVILAVSDVAPGETVGYSAAWRAERPSRIATIAAGYADGVPRSASSANGRSGGQVMIAGKYAPLAGRVSMDLITADVTDIDPALVAPGQLATLIGPGLSIEDAGFAAGTIGYEILTRCGTRFERVYVDE